MAKELAEEYLGRETEIASVRNAKYQTVLSPVELPSLNCLLDKFSEEDGLQKVRATFYKADVSFATISLTLKDAFREDPAAERLQSRGICVIIPVYNNEGTIARVIKETRPYCRDIIVVNDGSTDGTTEILKATKGVTLVELSHNKGKGAALKAGFRKALSMGFAYAITLDADGQHLPSDIPAFLQANIDAPGSLILGARNLENADRSKGSSFANKFSNFWFTVQTLRRVPDTQTGYRLYPLRKLHGLGLLTSRYEAELELLVFASWHGVKLVSIPINVYYPPKEERVSHFRPGKDFARISVLNTVLCVLALVYGLPLMVFRFLAAVVRSVYSLLFFVFFSVLVVTPAAWVYVNIGKKTPEKTRKLHGLIYRIARFLMLEHGIPGIRFTWSRHRDVDFEKPKVLVCNHQSHLDLMCMLIYSPKMVFLTNDWVWNNVFYGFLIRSAEYYPVSQGLDVIMPKLKDLVARGYSIAVFPEGTRSADCKIRRFHQGAFHIASELGLDVEPMCLYGAGRVLPKTGRWLRKGRIHIDAAAPFTRASLDAVGTELEQAAFARARCQEQYRRISDKVDQYV
ncbi:MAG: glycosyltransferase [Bacteroidales bacterium]|nr:glycosyltransferase [Bacteroidales bacterium]